MRVRREVLTGIARGGGYQTICKELNMGERTVHAMIDSMICDGYLEELRCHGCSMCSKGCGGTHEGEARMYVLTSKGLGFIGDE